LFCDIRSKDDFYFWTIIGDIFIFHHFDKGHSRKNRLKCPHYF
jgi:hypothetical protein